MMVCVCMLMVGVNIMIHEGENVVREVFDRMGAS